MSKNLRRTAVAYLLTGGFFVGAVYFGASYAVDYIVIETMLQFGRMIIELGR